MIALIIIGIVVLIVCIFMTDSLLEIFLTICIGIFAGVLSVGLLASHVSDKIDSLKEEKSSLIAEYSSCIDKSEIIKRIEKYNQSCDETENHANNVWKNPESSFKAYDLSDLKIDIDNLKD